MWLLEHVKRHICGSHYTSVRRVQECRGPNDGPVACTKAAGKHSKEMELLGTSNEVGRDGKTFEKFDHEGKEEDDSSGRQQSPRNNAHITHQLFLPLLSSSQKTKLEHLQSPPHPTPCNESRISLLSLNPGQWGVGQRWPAIWVWMLSIR